MLPNFFTEAKGPDGSAAVAKRQACFDGALSARGVHELRLLEANPTLAYDNNAYTIISSYHDGQLKMYTTHPTQSIDPGNSPEYHMTQLGGWTLTGSYEQSQQGASAFRNARDWAKTQKFHKRRHSFLKRANDLKKPCGAEIYVLYIEQQQFLTTDLETGCEFSPKYTRGTRTEVKMPAHFGRVIKS